ncbi:arylsulfotransferase family protein [Candidatus Zixiibacteriota bacterium]
MNQVLYRLEKRHWLSFSLMILVLSALFLISDGLQADEQTDQRPADWKDRLEKLRAVPYIGVSQTPVGDQGSGVMFFDPKRACSGYYLYCNRLTGDAFLMDVAGEVVHRWTWSPKRKTNSEPDIMLDDYAVMLENGDLLVMKKFMEVLRLNWNSRVLWSKSLDVHHELVQALDGSLYILLRELRDYRGLFLRNDIIAHLACDGHEIDRWRAQDHLAELGQVFDDRWFLDTILNSGQDAGELGNLVKRVEGRVRSARSGKQPFDYFHINAITPIPPTPLQEIDPRFEAGNLLVCFRNINQIAVVEKETYRVLWTWGAGELEWPHHPTILEDGHILLFDNGVNRRYSRVLELDPLTGVIVWQYQADPQRDFFSDTRGSAQRLPNGNTLILESNKGRAFQVTDEGEVVWEWLNPRVDAVYRGKPHRETVYRMYHYPSEQVDPLLQRWWWQ